MHMCREKKEKKKISLHVHVCTLRSVRATIPMMCFRRKDLTDYHVTAYTKAARVVAIFETA